MQSKLTPAETNFATEEKFTPAGIKLLSSGLKLPSEINEKLLRWRVNLLRLEYNCSGENKTFSDGIDLLRPDQFYSASFSEIINSTIKNTYYCKNKS